MRYWHDYLSGVSWSLWCAVDQFGVSDGQSASANDLHMVQLMPLPPLHLLPQWNLEWFILLVPADLDCPEKRLLNQYCGMLKVIRASFLRLTGSALAAKVRRNDSLARFLNQRPQQEELVQRHIIPTESEQERLQHRQQIGATLNR